MPPWRTLNACFAADIQSHRAHSMALFAARRSSNDPARQGGSRGLAPRGRELGEAPAIRLVLSCDRNLALCREVPEHRRRDSRPNELSPVAEGGAGVPPLTAVTGVRIPSGMK